jgi:PAS domain S-box-containing protein
VNLDHDAFRLLFEAHPRPMYVADRETLQILIVNRAACELYGWSREELLAMTIRDIRPREDVASFDRAYADATKAATSTYSRAGRHCTKDGRSIDVTIEISGEYEQNVGIVREAVHLVQQLEQ